MAAPTHPSFPSVSQHTRQYDPPPLPTNSPQLQDFIQSADTLDSIQNLLLPGLRAIAAGEGFIGKDKEKIIKGEEVLAMYDVDLIGLDDRQVQRMTAGLVYVVSARLNRPRKPDAVQSSDLLKFASRLCEMGDSDQLAMCLARLSSLARGMLQLAQQSKQIQHVIQPLMKLLDRSTHQGIFTGVHATILEACLLTRSFAQGMHIIQAEIFSDVQSAQPSYLEVLSYFHHAGLICAAVKDFTRAHVLFTVAVSMPTSAASAIQVACAKRAMLCNLLDTGKLKSFPNYTSSAVNRAIDRNLQEYVKLAKAFEAEEWADVRAAESVRDYVDDCNVGLVRQIIASIPKRRILRIKETYSRMRIDQLAQKIDMSGPGGEEEILRILKAMIDSGEIAATIVPPDQPLAIVSFPDQSPDYSSREVYHQVAREDQMAAWLEHQLSTGSRQMGSSHNYLKKQAALLEANGGKAGGKGRDTDFEALMAAEEPGAFAMKGPGANYADTGF